MKPDPDITAADLHLEFVEVPGSDPANPPLPGDDVVVEVQCRRCFEPDGTVQLRMSAKPGGGFCATRISSSRAFFDDASPSTSLRK